MLARLLALGPFGREDLVRRVWLFTMIGVTVPGPEDTVLPAIFVYARRPWCARKGRR